MPDATFACPDLTAFARLDELGLEVLGQRREPDRAVLACWVVEADQWCRRCGGEGSPRDSVVPTPVGHRSVSAEAAVQFIAPSDYEIEHMNVFKARSVCPLTQTSLPTLCWGSTPSAWTNVSTADRSLPNLLEAVRQVLSSANPDSRAR